MKTRACRQFHFSASHQLTCVPEGHPCRALHGHNYNVSFTFEGSNERAPMVIDYRAIKAMVAPVLEELDHAHLNSVLACEPTAENIALHLFLHVKALTVDVTGGAARLVCVRVSETETTWAEVCE